MALSPLGHLTQQFTPTKLRVLKARELSDRVIWAESICPAKRPAQVAAPLARTGEETNGLGSPTT